MLATHPIVVCGGSHVPWYNFERSITFLASMRRGHYSTAINTWYAVILSKSRIPLSADCLVPTESALEFYTKFVKGTMVTEFGFRMLLAVILLTGCFSWTIWMMLKEIDSARNKFTLNNGLNAILWCFTVPCLLLSIVAGVTLTISRRWDIEYHSPWLEEDAITHALYCRKATVPKDIAFSAWPVLQKVSSTEIPMLHYGTALDDVYWDLTIHIILGTKSLSLLYPAAAQSLPGVPSWVPDWSAHGTHPWSLISSPSRGSPDLNVSRVSEKKKQFYVELDETRRVITVRARPICKIATVAVFHQTSETLRDGECALHDENLRLIQLIVRSSVKKNNIRRFYPLFLASLDVDFSLFQVQQREEIHAWINFCLENRMCDLRQIMARLKSSNICKYESMLSTHITLCNSLARAKRVTLCATSLLGTDEEFLGICGRDARVGDMVLRISGVPQLLAVRDRRQGERAVELVSPVILGLGNLTPITLILGMLRDHYTRPAKDIELDERYVKYRIH
jgi:hypothetical protein